MKRGSRWRARARDSRIQLASELAARDGFGQALIDADTAMARATTVTGREPLVVTGPNEMERDLIASVSRAYGGWSQPRPRPQMTIAEGLTTPLTNALLSAGRQWDDHPDVRVAADRLSIVCCADDVLASRVSISFPCA